MSDALGLTWPGVKSELPFETEIFSYNFDETVSVSMYGGQEDSVAIKSYSFTNVLYTTITIVSLVTYTYCPHSQYLNYSGYCQPNYDVMINSATLTAINTTTQALAGSSATSGYAECGCNNVSQTITYPTSGIALILGCNSKTSGMAGGYSYKIRVFGTIQFKNFKLG